MFKKFLSWIKTLWVNTTDRLYPLECVGRTDVFPWYGKDIGPDDSDEWEIRIFVKFQNDIKFLNTDLAFQKCPDAKLYVQSCKDWADEWNRISVSRHDGVHFREIFFSYDYLCGAFPEANGLYCEVCKKVKYCTKSGKVASTRLNAIAVARFSPGEEFYQYLKEGSPEIYGKKGDKT